MGDRTLPYDENARCDGCGKRGATDFMGDYYCHKCVVPGPDGEAQFNTSPGYQKASSSQRSGSEQ